MLAENLPAKVWKLYPASKYAFVSQVEGGMKGTTCVVAARVMVLPLTATVRVLPTNKIQVVTADRAIAKEIGRASCRERV